MFLSVELWKVSCCSQGPTGCLTSRAKTAKCGSNKKWQTCASNKTATSRQIKLKSDSPPLFYPPSQASQVSNTIDITIFEASKEC